MLFEIPGKIIDIGIAQRKGNIRNAAIVAAEQFYGFFDTQRSRIRQGRYAVNILEQLPKIRRGQARQGR